MSTSTPAVLKDPSISDEEVEQILNLSCFKDAAPAVLFLDPSPTLKGENSSQKPWPVFARPYRRAKASS